MRKRILSIDFDYFIDTSLAVRNEKFPDGGDNVPAESLLHDWNMLYEKYPELKDIGVIRSFDLCLEKISGLRCGKVLIAESHGDIAKLFPLINREDELEVLHLDFHHDNYISGGDKIDCANWVRHLMQVRPDAGINWVRREDSERESLSGNFPYPSTLDFVIDGEFDYIFLCFSPEWTPPHLRSAFDEMCRAAEHLEHIYA